MTYSDRINLLQLIGSNIRLERTKNNFSVRELAQLLGLSEQTISSMERGARGTNIENYSKMADVFDTTIDHLIGRDMYREDIGFHAPNSKKNMKLLLKCSELNEAQAELVLNFIDNLIKYTGEVSDDEEKKDE
ncbi:MAG: helix-turn-helix transcriptional regulator [Firmicutes bacterium]|nr:helix-turn-helix transcriptional regulator [Bacillota bacterium]